MIDKIVAFFKDFLYLSYQDARGFFNLLAICFLALGLFFGVKIFWNRDVQPDMADIHKLDSLARILDNALESAIKPIYFSFDPNTLLSDSLELLGFPKKLAERLINFRNKGAVFRVKSDLKNVYGFPEDLFESLSTYIDLPDNLSKAGAAGTSHYLNINQADTKSLAAAAGIDAAMAQRILNYRYALGGYMTESQLDEVYGIAEEDLEDAKGVVFIKRGFIPKKIMINHADENALKAHPYISDQLAADIMRFREINGRISSSEELSGFKSVTSGDFDKLILYLDFDH